jgi:hypothetical protein
MSIAMRMVLSLTFVAALLLQAGLFAEEKKKDQDSDDKKPVKVFEVDAALATTDPKDKSAVGSFCKTYKQKLVEGRSYQIDLTSKAFDAFLRLEDAKGKAIAEDDDGAGKGTDAHIKYKAAKTGEFTIVCTTFAPGETGKFTLSIHEVTDGPVNVPKEDKAKSPEKK